MNKSAVPAVSLRDLMAEAEAEQKQETHRKLSTQTLLEKRYETIYDFGIHFVDQ